MRALAARTSKPGATGKAAENKETRSLGACKVVFVRHQASLAAPEKEAMTAYCAEHEGMEAKDV
eukprot:scaffold76137_cov16-Tisochrysis_lutea.AAC.2